MIRSRHVGRFFVASKFVSEDNDLMRRLMDKIIVLEAGYEYARDGFNYVAICEDFEEVPPHLHIPQYSVLCSGDPIKITFQKDAFGAQVWK